MHQGVPVASALCEGKVSAGSAMCRANALEFTMSLNRLTGVPSTGRTETAHMAVTGSTALAADKRESSTPGADAPAAHGVSGLAEAMQLSLKQLGLSVGSTAGTDSGVDKTGNQRKVDMGHLMQALFQAVQAHSPPLANGESSSFAAALASVTTQLSSGDSLQIALGRVLKELQASQTGATAKPSDGPTAHDLLTTLQRNLDAQGNTVNTKGNVLNSRA